MSGRSYAGIAYPGVLVALMGIYAYWAAQRELVSSRPPAPGEHNTPDPVPVPGVRTFHSRMWEDPLSTAYEHWSSLPEEERSIIANPVQDSQQYDDKTLGQKVSEAAHPPPEEPSDSTEDASAEPAADGPLDQRIAEVQETFRELVDDSGDRRTLCLPVFLPGGPYAEDKEKRQRIRYSVVTALAESGYHLKYNSRMSYVVPKIHVRVLRGWQEREIVVPVKLYDNPRANQWLVVLWINEAELGLRPLLATHRILNRLFSTVERGEQLDVSIVGPASSGVLEYIAQENVSDHWYVDSYNPPARASGFAPLWDIDETEEHNLLKRVVSIYSPRATSEIDDPAMKSVRLHRVIGTDRQLADGIGEELERRGALPGNVLLITEHDTSYGRKIEQSFKDAFAELGATADAGYDFYTFKVLRGIDGILPGDDVSSGRAALARQASSQTAMDSSDDVVERLPEGRSQYDYLSRLPQQIEEITHGKPISAIGVVGSDVYDKLLALRALKPHFPDCIFFTTDLDAIYTHPYERKHTRNLIVASHFGLTLGSRLQQHTLPFRDSYQTAFFLATRLAIHHRDTEFLKADENTHWKSVVAHCCSVGIHPTQVEPMLHVVGRDQVQQLTGFNEGTIENIVHPAPVWSTGGWRFFYATSLVLVVVGFISILMNREWISKSVLLCGGGEDFNDRRARSVIEWRRELNFSFGVPVGIGFLLLIGLWLNGQFGEVVVSLTGGYSTLPRNMLYALAGMFAILSTAYLLDRLIVTLNECTQRNSAVAELAWDTFRITHVLKAGVLAVAASYASVLFVHGFDSLSGWATAILGFLGLGAVLRFYRPPARKDGCPLSKNVILSEDARPLIYWVLGAMALATLAEVMIDTQPGGPRIGWSPASISRGSGARFADWLASIYAFVTVPALIVSVLFAHAWSREFARYVKAQFGTRALGSNHMELSADQEFDLLWIIGRLTAVPVSLAPALMTLLLVLIIAYHPVLSPVPMPSGLLIIATLAMALFIGASLLQRWHFNRERNQTLARLQLQLWDLEAMPLLEDDSKSTEPDTTAEAFGSGVPVDDDQGGVKLAPSPPATRIESEIGAPSQELLELRRKQIESLSDGVFRPWNQSPGRWLLGGGASLALVDLWVRWWMLGM